MFTRSVEGCGGDDTTFDSFQVYLPSIIDDTATSAAPCPGIADGLACWRMWYVGNDDDESRAVGLAVSSDGQHWARVPGAAPGGAVLGSGSGFDPAGASAPSVVKDGDTYKMWYTGLGPDNSIEGIGLATSTDGVEWTRVPGPLTGGAVLRASGRTGDFDRDETIIAHVIKDEATSSAPCTGAEAGDPCFRMWYEGVDTEDYYRYRIGYATSPDGITWTKVRGDDPSGAVFGLGAKGAFDDRGVGAPFVVRDGAIYRMWYEAFDGARFSIGYATSVDGLHWQRPEGARPAFQGGDDPGTFDDDSVWTATVLKDLVTYRMWYTVSAKPESQRFGLAELTPGSRLTDLQLDILDEGVELRFTTSRTIPAGGSILVDLGATVQPTSVTLGGASGFGRETTGSVEAALTDQLARGVARDVVVLRAEGPIPPGAKRLTIETDVAPGTLTAVVQTFDTSEVLEYGTVRLA